DTEPAALADGEMDDSGMRAKHGAVEVNNLAGFGGTGLEALDHLGIAAGRHEADVLAVVLVGDRQAKAARQLARLGLALVTQRETQQLQLLPRRRKQEIALITLLLAGAIERATTARERPRRDVVAGREHLGAELAGGHQQVAELDRLVAINAGHR